jgi:diguanylate cyclase (GGDEF)-like protein/PAS domain S-box-containing protein
MGFHQDGCVGGERAASLSGASRASEEFLGRAIDELPGVALLSFDSQMRFTSAAGGALRKAGYSPESLVGRRPSELAGEAWPALEEHFAQALTGQRDARTQVEFTLDGKVVYWALISPLRDVHGGIVGGVLALCNATAQPNVEAALAKSEREFREVMDQSADMLTRHDVEGRYLYVSPACEQVVGYQPEELIGHHPLQFVHPEDRERVAATIEQAGPGGAGFEVEHRVMRPDGSCVWVHALVRIRVDEHGQPHGVGAVRDITAKKEQEARLRDATERFERAFDQAPIGMALVGLNGRWLRVNRALCDITGYSESELLQRCFKDITHPDDVEKDLKVLAKQWSDERETYETEKRYIHADGRVIWVGLSTSVVRDEDGEPLYMVSQTQEITGRKQFEERLTYLADHDSLTGLYNRRRFESELERQVLLCRRYGEHAALLVLDLDHFKYVNDSLGHSVGDRVIEHIARLVSERLRKSDVVARLGGDEFAVILPHTAAEHALHAAAELVAHIEARPFAHAGHNYVLSGSVGVVMLDPETASSEDALVNADLTMYDAKLHGRNRVAVYSPETREDILDGLSWSQRLKDALSNDGFALLAQPIVDLQTGEAVMHELLIRLRSEDGQLIAPGRFLHAAARFGFISAIDHWVIAQAAQLAGAAPGRCLTVNLAAKTIAEPGLVAYVTEQLACSGADPADLVFELSESDIIANLDQARSACERLRALGARIALDDFGSGFSGFSYLKALEVDVLKIDGQFVKELASNRVDRLVVEAILHVANGMGLPTVAEYVTDDAVAEQLRKLGATYGQGFCLGKPAPLEPQ